MINQVEYNKSTIRGWVCEDEKEFRYKYRFLRAVTETIPSSATKDSQDVTKVQADHFGLLSIQHMMSARSTNVDKYACHSLILLSIVGTSSLTCRYVAAVWRAL